jgi:hypothetical protein
MCFPLLQGMTAFVVILRDGHFGGGDYGPVSKATYRLFVAHDQATAAAFGLGATLFDGISCRNTWVATGPPTVTAIVCDLVDCRIM